MKKQHSIFLLPGIIMMGVALRTPFTTLPTVLTDIANGLHVSVNSLGLLTSLPLDHVCSLLFIFGAFSEQNWARTAFYSRPCSAYHWILHSDF